MSTDESADDPHGTAGEILAAWRAELGALAGHALRGDRDELVVECTGDGIVLLWAGHELGRVARDGEQAPRAMRQLLSGVKRGDAVLKLAASDVLRPLVRLPYASERVLRSALQYELEKLSPIPPSDVYFDFRILSRDRAENMAEVELRIIRRDIVDGMIERCRAAGLKIGAVRFVDDARDADPGAFPVDRMAVLRDQWRRNSVAILAAAVIVLVLALTFVTYMRGSETLDALTDEIATESIAASRVEQLQSRIDRATKQLTFLGQQKRAPLFAQVLADVTHTLPDGTWITEFDMTSGSKIRIGGFSRSASDLIAVVDRSGKFANAQFAAPVTQGAGPGIERFDLTFDIVGGAK